MLDQEQNSKSSLPEKEGPEKEGPEKEWLDPFGRKITYLRLSVTDRCDFRCIYCMDEKMKFLPKKEVLSIEELIRLSNSFINRGVNTIRLSGGEPLVRRGIMSLVESLGKKIKSGDLKELTLTTNGNSLEKYAEDLYTHGVRRINLSLDTLNQEKFRLVTRLGKIENVLKGAFSAQKAGLKIKVNMVVLKGTNDDEILEMLQFCQTNNMDLTLIESMPIGQVSSNRDKNFYPLTSAIDLLKTKWHLKTSEYKTPGPARYFDIEGSDNKLGIISPLTNNFCATCNRLRVTCTGQIYLCLGHDDHIDLRKSLRASKDDELLNKQLDDILVNKPKKHHFNEAMNNERPATIKNMNLTGG